MNNIVSIVSIIFCATGFSLAIGFFLGSNRTTSAETIMREEIGKWDASALMRCCPECQKERQEQVS